MSQNFYDDYLDRIEQITKYSDLSSQVLLFEECFGEKGTFKDEKEAMEVYAATLSEVGKFAATEIAPIAEKLDKQGARFENGEVILPELLRDAIKKAVQMGLLAGVVTKKSGGLNMPHTVTSLCLEMLGQACPNLALTLAAYSAHSFFEYFASESQKAEWMSRMIAGEVEMSMALTEPNAGSDLGNLKASGKKEGDHYLINGTKHFITNGSGDLTFVLVRTDPKSTGLLGLSVLMVSRKIDGKLNYKVSKIEEKICLHSSPTCELVFEDSIGHLIGKEGDGFKVMLRLMNEARIAVGAIAIGICQAAFDKAKDYAKTRVSMGKPIIKHPMIADMLYEMDLEIKAMRALLIEASVAYDWLRIYEKRGDEKNAKKWKKRYLRLTPVVKYYSSEKCVLITRNALQIFGGYGVCKDYPMERFYRESVIYPIYEGTSQIQSLMVLKDTLKDVATHSTGFLGSLAGAWAESKISVNPVRSKLLLARNELNQAIKTVMQSILKDKFKANIEGLKEQNIQDFLSEFSLKLLTPKTDLTVPFLSAERLTKIVCDYYALKTLVDHYEEGDKKRERTILEYADLILPRMKKENEYLENRQAHAIAYMNAQEV